MFERWQNPLWIVAGSLMLIIGTVGIFVPILPTTPFLLLTAACYARGSDRFHRWLLNNRVFGSYVRDYYEGRGIPLRTKIWTITLLWLTLGYSAWRIDPLHARLGLAVVAVGVTVHLLTKPTRRD